MNNLRHIIVEGPDGSGKDTLISSLLELFTDHTLHERASTSLGGPVPNLAAWVTRDVATMDTQPPSIYNRHPLVSELIYWRYRSLRPGYRSVEWTQRPWRESMRRAASQYALIVFCRPPLCTVVDTVNQQGPDAHMPGVYHNIRAIYSDYDRYQWPGISMDYDYTKDTIPVVVNKITRALLHGRI
jgi:hypothetical protein